MKKVLLDITKDADLESIGEARRALQDVLVACDVGSVNESNMALCFTELATNSVQHGEGVSNIGLQLYTDIYGWWIVVKDDGEPIDKELFSPPASKGDVMAPFNLEREGGRGISIVSHLSEQLTFIPQQELLETESKTNIIWSNGICMGWCYPRKYKQPHVLIVDDDPAIRALYSNYLEKMFNVGEVGNGAEALNYIKEFPVDIVISDINMPTMNGIQLRDAMVADGNMELIPFVFLSMTNAPQLIEQANMMGIDDFLFKPIDKAALIQAVNRVLSRSLQLKSCLGKRIDQQISRALSPVLPTELFGYRLSLTSRNTGSGGGDIVLHHQYQDKALIIIVDVMGHNDASKFFSYAYAGYIKGLLSSLDSTVSPERLIEDISKALYDDTLMSQLMLTCCVLELTSNNQIKIACAGHPQPLLLSTEKGLKALPVSGTLAGLLPSLSYSPFVYECQPGERIAVYTDGLIDSLRDKAGVSSEDVVFDAIKSSISLPLKQSAEYVFKVFDQETKNAPVDDALLLLIES